MEIMLEYPIAVAGIFSKGNDQDPVCTICFFATAPVLTSKQEVENYICFNIFPQLVQAINSGPDMVAGLIDRYAVEISERFDITCRGYLNAAHLSGTPRGGIEGK